MDSPDQRRTRIEFDLPAIVRDSEGHELAATVLDISGQGCRLRCEGELLVGERVEIRMGDDDVHAAIIRWALGGEAGAEFLEGPAL